MAVESVGSVWRGIGYREGRGESAYDSGKTKKEAPRTCPVHLLMQGFVPALKVSTAA